MLRAAWLASSLLLLAPGAYSQPVRKPSAYESGAGSPVHATANRASSDALPALATQQDFDRLARVYDAGSQGAMPHVLFAIDRHARPTPQLYFINTPRFQLHENFLRRKGMLQGDRAALNRNYRDADRRFLLGTLSWQPVLSGYTYEFWEGDRLTPTLLRTTAQSLQAGFFAPLRFKSNSTAQQAVGEAVGEAVVTQEALLGAQTFIALNTGAAVGRLRVAATTEAALQLAPQDIVVLREVPISLPPVSGVLTERPSTMLSHVNLLARGWGIPNAFVQDAARQLATWDGQWVHLDVHTSDFTVRAATESERDAAQQALQRRATARTGGQRLTIAPDLRQSALQPLSALRQSDRKHCGAKAANLGEVRAARLTEVEVPDGFCIPFAAYADFMRQHGLSERIARMRQQPGFTTDAGVRRRALAALREEIAHWPLDTAQTQAWQQRWQSQLAGQGVFVRSSSSSEDLPGFSGAGLYTTVPNVRSAAGLVMAVRQVWASVYNFEAWEARVAAGIAESEVAMAVLVQTAVDSSASGVMITRDPFDTTRRHATYIAAKRGIGIRVVEGQRVAEQIIYSSRSKAIQVLNRSDDDVALQLNPAGGVREVPTAAGRAVLTDALVKRLAKVGQAVQQRFGGRSQDIEWALQGEQILVLQARPFVNAPPR